MADTAEATRAVQQGLLRAMVDAPAADRAEAAWDFAQAVERLTRAVTGPTDGDVVTDRLVPQVERLRASEHQYREAYSHRTQEAEHYRAALGLVVERLTRIIGSARDQRLTDTRDSAVRALREVPPWDGTLRP